MLGRPFIALGQSRAVSERFRDIVELLSKDIGGWPVAIIAKSEFSSGRGLSSSLIIEGIKFRSRFVFTL